jgi:hypothetical protein
MKRIKQVFAPIGLQRIRIIFRYGSNGKVFAFEGKLNAFKNPAQIDKILFKLWK